MKQKDADELYWSYLHGQAVLANTSPFLKMMGMESPNVTPRQLHEREIQKLEEQLERKRTKDVPAWADEVPTEFDWEND